MMPWAVLGITVFFFLFSWMIIQGTRASMAYRKAAAEGDLDVIRQILDDSINHWRSQRRPKEVPPGTWRSIQSLELVGYGPEHAHVSALAEGEQRMVEGAWQELASPLQEAYAVTAKALDMLLYEVPNHKLASVQLDVYTTFRDESGASERRCILSTVATREAARAVDWDSWQPVDVVDAFSGRYRLGDFGRALPIEPLSPAADEVPAQKLESAA
ncbi:MAG TPA: hypothetical protein VFB90_04835 [Dehalococcoidia bacterium]|nr:hypothetical protein [Dehalococcoidia bacterium]